MRIEIIIASLLASALAAPAAVPAPVDTSGQIRNSVNNHIAVPIEAEKLNVYPQLVRRQGRCDVEYCQQVFNSCVKTCTSLTNGDWYVRGLPFHRSYDAHALADIFNSFDAQTSPSCEGCDVLIEGC